MFLLCLSGNLEDRSVVKTASANNSELSYVPAMSLWKLRGSECGFASVACCRELRRPIFWLPDSFRSVFLLSAADMN